MYRSNQTRYLHKDQRLQINSEAFGISNIIFIRETILNFTIF